jgi:hypothetical protein
MRITLNLGALAKAELQDPKILEQSLLPEAKK